MKEIPLNILVIEDAAGQVSALLPPFDALAERIGREVEYQHVASVAGTQRAVDNGGHWDIALVDLDLGVLQPTGLAALATLSAQPDPPRLVLWTEPYDVDRTMCAVAAGSWFDIKATYNKVGGRPIDEDMRAVANLLHGVLTGTSASLPHHTISPIVKGVFDDFVQPREFAYWKAFATEGRADTAAALIPVAVGTLRRWMAKENLIGPCLLVVRFWRAVETAAAQDAPSAPRDAFRTQIARAGDEQALGNPTETAHSFATSQRLFFLDPYVTARITGRDQRK